MAFKKENLNKIGGQSLFGNAAQVITYNNKDGDTVTSEGYFNAIADIVAVGDLIHVVEYTSTTPSSMDTYIVSSNSGGVVAVVSAVTATSSGGSAGSGAL